MRLEGTIVIGVYECTSRRRPLEGAPLYGRCPIIVSLTEIYQSSSSFSPARERPVARTELKIFRPGPTRIFSPIPSPYDILLMRRLGNLAEIANFKLGENQIFKS